MFNLVRRYPLFRKIVLLLFLTPLMFTGGSFLGGLAQQQNVGEVGSLTIPRDEFVYYFQTLSERYRSAYGVEELSEDMQREISRQVQSELLSRYLLRASIDSKGVFAPDDAVAAAIREVSDFQDEDGNFSAAIYRRNVSDHRRYLRQTRNFVNGEPLWAAFNAVPVDKVRDKLAAFRRQQRVVDDAVVAVDDLATTVTLDVSAEDINLYYQRNLNRYAISEEADFEYFVVSLNTYAANQTVSEEDARVEYDDYAAAGDVFQRRKISHIYVGDQQQADDLFNRATADNFAELAKAHSQDAGSAEKGGDLGIIAVGDLPLEMEDAVFALTVGEVAPPVEVDDGYSILKLDALISEEVPSFDDLREEMELRARRTAATGEFEEAVAALGERTAEEIGSLQALADSAGTEVATVAAVQRDPRDNDYPFNDEVAIEDAFESFVVEDGENSNPIPLGEDAYLFVRSTRYQQAGNTPLSEAADEINGILRARNMINILHQELAAAREDGGTTDENAAVSAEEASAEEDLLEEGAAATAEETLAEEYLLEGATVVAEEAPEKDLLTRLGEVEWENVHTVVLANIGDNAAVNTDANTDGVNADDSRADDGASEDDGAALAGRSINLIFTADLSRGLPGYAFEPLENKIRIFRIREVTSGEPQEEDFEVIDEMLTSATEELSNIGYMTELMQQHDFEFYNLPELGLDSAPH